MRDRKWNRWVWALVLGLGAFSVSGWAGDFSHSTKVSTTVLEECFVDQEFEESYVQEKHVFGSNGFKWFVATYTHSFKRVQKLLIVAVSPAGEIYEREVTSARPETKDFSFRADYHEQYVANNFATQKRRLTQAVEDTLRIRRPFQCAQ